MKRTHWICSLILFPALGWGQGYTITTFAGGGNSTSSGVPATQEQVSPGGVTVDAAGNVYIANGTISPIISKVATNGIITTIAGSPTSVYGFSGDGGPATSAQFSFNQDGPTGIAVDALGNVYIADTGNNRVRKIGSNGVVSTVAGGGSGLNYGDGGPATATSLDEPFGVAVDSAGNIYIVEWMGNRVRKVTPDGTISTVAGCTPTNVTCFEAFLSGSINDGGPATNAPLQLPTAVAVDAAGNLYIADTGNHRIRKVSTNGIITTVAGSASGSYSGDGGPATSAGLNQPNGVAVDAAGNIYLDDAGDYRIRMVAGGTITTIAGNGAEGQAFTTPASGVPATSTSLGLTYGVAVGAGGAVYVADVDYGVRLLKSTSQSGGAAPTVQSGGVVGASAFGATTSVAPGSLIEIYGSNLATDTRGWSGADFNGVNAPTSLDGTSVTIGGQPAYVAYISPTQVNAQVPSNVSTGSQPLIVRTSADASSTVMVNVNATAPGLLAPSSFNISGKQYVAAFFQDGSFALPPGSVAGVTSRQAQPSDILTLYGVGFGSVTPNIPAGQLPEQGNTLTLTFSVNFGSTPASVAYDGLAPGLVGVYQFNVVVPSVPASNAVPVTFTLNGVPGTQTLYTAVAQ